MRYLLAATIFLYCGDVMAQQYPVCSFKMYSAVSGETPLTHTQQIAKTFPLYQSASFNWGLPFINKNYYYQPHQTISDAEIAQLLDSASAHNVNIILPDVVSWYAGTERFYLDANAQYFNTIRGVVDPDGQAERPSVFYDNSALRATMVDVNMVEGAKYQAVHPWFPGLAYRAYFRLKVSRPTGFDPNAEIGQVEIYDITANNSVLMKTLKNGDFGAENVYQTIDAGVFRSDGNPETGSLHQFDFRVMWYGGQTTLWLDNIRVEGSFRTGTNPAALFSGGYDAAIKSAAKKFNAHPALARFYLSDEPCITMYLAYNYVNNVLKIADQENGVNPNTGKGLAYVAKTQDDAGFGTYSRFTQEANPHELATDIYRFYKNDPLPSDPNYTSFAQNNALQSAIYHFKLAQQSSIYSETGTWQYFPNISRFTNATREPYLAEVYSQVNLALAYGAKGVHYFHYWTVNDGSPDFPIGLIDPVTLDPINSASQYSIYHENKWDGIKSLNQKLAGPVGTTLMNLTWQNAYSIHLQPSLAGTYIASVATSDAANERYVELGLFKDASNRDYFMLVNRRTKSDESRNITVTFNNASSWEITDVASGKIWIIPQNGNFADNFSPGEGKLYKIGPATWSITKSVRNTVTILSGAILTINPGSSICFAPGASLVAKGTLNAQGAAPQQITFTSTGGTSTGSWGSIVLDGSGASGSILNNCTIQYATDLQILNGASVALQNSTIKNCTRGTYVYNANANINGNHYQDNPNDIYCNATGYTHQIHNNTFTKLSGSSGYYHGGVAINSSYPSIAYISHNDITGYGNGMYIGSSTAYFLKNQNGPYTAPNNRIRDCSEGVVVGWGGSLLNNAYYFMWYSSIYNNQLHDLYAYQSGTIYSICDYFGGGNPKTLKDGTSTISVSSPLSYNPWGPGKIAASPLVQANGTNEDDATLNLLDEGLNYEQRNDYAGAIEYYKDLIKQGKVSKLVFTALAHSGAEAGRKDVTSYFEDLKRSDNQYQPLVMQLLAGLYTRQGEGEKGAALYDEIISTFANTHEEKMAWFQKFYHALHVKNDSAEASRLLSTIKAKYSDDDAEGEIALAESLLGSTVEGSRIAGKKAEIPAQIALLDNYPNPFNPTTIINYQLPVMSRISLKVYDLLGREVVTLADGLKEAGYHTATFDGSRLSSGVYFTRLTVQPQEGKPFVQVRKMVLSK
jgi:hypothetical protein